MAESFTRRKTDQKRGRLRAGIILAFRRPSVSIVIMLLDAGVQPLLLEISTQ